MLPDAKLDQVLRRYDEVQALLGSGKLASDRLADLSREFSGLEPVVTGIAAYRRLQAELADAEAMLADAGVDAEMRDLADAERRSLQDRLPEAERALQLLLLPQDEADSRNAILEIRAGTGGEEAALFAANLLRMYQRHAELHGWRLTVMDGSETDLGGWREVIAEVSGKDVFRRLKFESGVHRVQRVPETEAGGRIHTSAATVAVLPEAEEVDIQIRDEDLRIDVYRSSGAGGQHVNTTDSAVRITHLPTGLVVTQQDEKSQHRNKAKALKVLRARLYDQQRHQADAERAAARKGQVGSGDRSERIRTYNFPQGRVTDHRINLTLYKLDRVMIGESLDELIDALIADDQAARLSADDAA
ncbi:MAG: peptide chain release factor 1 [Sneathiellaceae bacterium]